LIAPFQDEPMALVVVGAAQSFDRSNGSIGRAEKNSPTLSIAFESV